MDAALERDLLAHQGFLRRLARELVGDDALAEDLVQEANVQALTRPPKDPGALRAWLATVTRRLAASHYRSGGRRSNREREVARPERTSGGLPELDRRLDAQALVLELMRKLPDAQRQVLLMRYADEFAPAEIARRLGEPVDTVKTRLRRGLERLRAELDRTHDGGRASWTLALLPTASATPGPPARSIPTGQAAPVWPLAAVGGVAVLVASAIVASAILLDTDAREERGALPEADVALAPVTEPARSLVSEATPPRAEIPATAVASALPGELEVPVEYVSLNAPTPRTYPGPSWGLRVRTVGAQAPGAEVEVRARFAEYGTPGPVPLKGRLDASGTTLFDVGPMLREAAASPEGRLAELLVLIDEPHLAPAEASLVVDPTWNPEAEPARELELVLALDAAAIVVGRLVPVEVPASLAAWTGERVEDPSLHVAAFRREDGRPAAAPMASDRTAEDGSFRLRVDGEGAFTLLGLGMVHRPASLPVELLRGSVTDVGSLTLEAGEFLEGTVDAELRTHHGTQITVCAGLAVPTPSWHETGAAGFQLASHVVWRNGAFERYGACVGTDEAGRFRLSGLCATEYGFNTHLEGWRTPFPLDEIRVRAPATGVALGPRGARLSLRLVLPQATIEAGTPWELVSAEGEVAIWESSTVSGTGEGWAPRDGEVVLRIDGEERRESLHGPGFLNDPNLRFELPAGRTVELDLLLPGLVSHRLSCALPGIGARLERELVLVAEAEPELASVRLVLGALDLREGEPFVLVHRAEGHAEVEQDLAVSGGALTVRGLPAGVNRFTLTRGRDRFATVDYWQASEFELTLRAGEAREHRLELARGGALVLELLDAEGRRIEARCTLVGPDGEESSPMFVANDKGGGRIAGYGFLFDCGPNRAVPDLPPGRYELILRRGEQELREALEIHAGRTEVRKLTFP